MRQTQLGRLSMHAQVIFIRLKVNLIISILYLPKKRVYRDKVTLASFTCSDIFEHVGCRGFLQEGWGCVSAWEEGGLFHLFIYSYIKDWNLQPYFINRSSGVDHWASIFRRYMILATKVPLFPLARPSNNYEDESEDRIKMWRLYWYK